MLLQHRWAVCCRIVRLFFFFHSVYVLIHPNQSLSPPQEVQTAGARFTKHGPELLEHVVWSQQLWVLRLRNGTNDWAQVNDKAALGSTKDFYGPLPEEKDPGQLPHLLPLVGGAEKVFHPPVLLRSWWLFQRQWTISWRSWAWCSWTASRRCKWVAPGICPPWPHLFAPFLDEMSNLQRIRFFPIHVSAFKKQEQDYLPVQITSQFLRLGHLQDLHLESPSFLEGCLDQMLRWVCTTDWVTLSIRMSKALSPLLLSPRMWCSTTTQIKVGGYTGLVALVRHPAREIQISDWDVCTPE